MLPEKWVTCMHVNILGTQLLILNYLHSMGYFLCLIGPTGSPGLPVGNTDGTLNKSHIPVKFLKNQKYKPLFSFYMHSSKKQNKTKKRKPNQSKTPNLANYQLLTNLLKTKKLGQILYERRCSVWFFFF